MTTAVYSQIGPQKFSQSHVTEVFNRGLFNPFKEKLDKPIYQNERDTWWGYLTNGTKEREICLLFAIAVDNSLTLRQKRARFQEVFASYSVHNISTEFVPPVIATHILQCCDENTLKEVVDYRVKYEEIGPSKQVVACWIMEALRAGSDPENFIHNIFAHLPEVFGNNVLYYFEIHSSDEDKKVFSARAPKELQVRLEGLTKDVIQWGRDCLDRFKVEKIPLKIKFQDHAREYFLSWFIHNALDHPDADLFAIEFEAEDWEWLYNQFPNKPNLKPHPFLWVEPAPPSPLTKKMIQWLTASLRRDLPNPDTLTLYLFFHYATKWFQIDNLPALQREMSDFAGTISLKLLTECWSKSGKDFRHAIIVTLIDHYPEKLQEWIKFILAQPEKENDKTPRDLLGTLFYDLSDFKLIDKLMPLINALPLEASLKVYCHLRNEYRAKILRHVSPSMICEWIKLCVHRRVSLRMVDAFKQDLHELLSKDPTMIPAVLERIDYQEFVGRLNPNAQSAERWQQEAIANIRICLLDATNVHQTREPHLDSLRKDLEGGERRVVWATKLFQALPPQCYPHLFHYFPYALYALAQERQFDFIQWVHLAFPHFFQNPFLRGLSDQSESMQKLIKVLNQTNTLDPVFQPYLQKTDGVGLINLINLILYASYHDDNTPFYTKLNAWLGPNKLAFIAKCLEAHLMNANEQLSMGGVATGFWDKPFVSSDKERAELTQAMIARMGVHFLRAFLTDYFPTDKMIESFNRLDPIKAEEIFSILVELLTKIQDSPPVKIQILEKICVAYALAKVDVIPFLEKMRGTKSYDAIENAYATHVIENLVTEKVHLQLLKLFNPKGFQEIVLKYIQAIFSAQENIYFYGFDALIANLDLMGEKENIIAALKANHAIFSLLTTYLDKKLGDAMIKATASLVFITNVVPDWQIRMTAWVQNEIASEKKKAKVAGNRPHYWRIATIFERLQKIQQLDPFLATLRASKEVQPDIEAVHNQFLANRRPAQR